MLIVIWIFVMLDYTQVIMMLFRAEFEAHLSISFFYILFRFVFLPRGSSCPLCPYLHVAYAKMSPYWNVTHAKMFCFHVYTIYWCD